MGLWWGVVFLVLACGTPSSGPRPATPRDAAPSEIGASPGAIVEQQHDTDAGVFEGDEGGADATDTIKIATFNIQIFGRTKASKPAIMSQLVAIIREYDVIAVQEIKDSSGSAPNVLLHAVNDGGDRTYAMLLSPRTGLQADDKSSQEQYAVLYDTALVEALPGDRLFDDDDHDLFQREPYLTPLRVRDGGFSFVLIGIHTRPESAVEEIGALHDVIEWARAVFPDEDDFIALGDFNAGCDYASPTQLDALDLRGPSYFWIVPDDSDSNVSPTTACAYDRIVTTVGAKAAFTGDWGVDRAFSDKAVSDHWPVWAAVRAKD
jgi:endonuclease/exonuclease/phosphatase family metal-dependent hydrolase